MKRTTPLRLAVGLLIALCSLRCSMAFRDADWREDETGNNAIQPPAEVMDLVGVTVGMTIGEFGAGYGRFTLPLAARVGPGGYVYANDVEESSLAFLRERCQDAGLKNVRTVLGTRDDPGFPKGSLDMALSALVYHEIEHPALFLKNLIPALKPGAPLVIVDNDPKRNTEKSNAGRDWETEFRQAGLEIVQTARLRERDVLFVLRVKGGQ
jgi:ubiquinone/menaquinone biosynthesis C-methylase UbiE